MYKVTIKNEVTGFQGGRKDCASYQEAQDWFNYQVSKPSTPYGKGERWIKSSEVSGEFLNRIRETRVHHIKDEDGQILDSYEESLIKADYIVLYQDITDQVQKDHIKKVVKKAMNFGQQLMVEFSTENVLLGITQDGMTKTVRKNMNQVMSALMSGSLYDAIDEIKVIPEWSKDSKYITNARLLEYVNKIEDYLGIELSTNLNQ